MNTADMAQFGAALLRLGRVFSRGVPQDIINDYFDDLAEFPWPDVERAIAHVRKTAKFWPRPSQIREACLLVPGVAHGTEVPSWVNHDEGRFCCDTCQDTGFERGLECDGSGVCHIGSCGRAGSGGPHPYTRACSCRASNAMLMRDREAQRQRTAPQQDRGQS